MGGGWNQICDFASMQGLCVLQEHGVSFEGMREVGHMLRLLYWPLFAPALTERPN